MNTSELLKLVRQAEADFREYRDPQKRGVLTHVQRLTRHKEKYIVQILSAIGVLPRSMTIKVKTFWGKRNVGTTSR